MARSPHRSFAAAILAVVACQSGSPLTLDGGQDGARSDASLVDRLRLEAGASDRRVPDTRAPDLGPNARLLVEQIALDGLMGEAALVLGPDGTSVLIDLGGAGHGPKILEAIDRRIGKRSLDWVILTHYHYDHVGSLVELVTPSSANGSQPVQVQRGVISRGLYDVDGELASTTAVFVAACQELAKPAWSGKLYDLCEGPARAPCDGKGSGDPWPASGCAGLLQGDLLDPGDDGKGELSSIGLGGGARLYLFHANGHVATKTGVRSVAQQGITLGHGGTDPENARSLGGVISWGSFSYSFHGDTTAVVEGFIAGQATAITRAPSGTLLIPAGSLDVTHLSHHGLDGSTSQAWVDWLLPADGKDRNAVVGANASYLLTPSPGVLSRVGPRIGTGYVWLTLAALLGGTHPRLRLANGAVVLEVRDAGARYDISALTVSGPALLQSYSSTP